MDDLTELVEHARRAFQDLTGMWRFHGPELTRREWAVSLLYTHACGIGFEVVLDEWEQMTSGLVVSLGEEHSARLHAAGQGNRHAAPLETLARQQGWETAAPDRV